MTARPRQQNVSHHLEQLVDAAVIVRERRGGYPYHALVDGVLNRIATLVTSASAPRRCSAARSGTSPTSARRCPRDRRGRRFSGALVMSAFLMFAILAVATDTRAFGEAAAIAIGGTIALDALFGGPITGASINPMRSLGPALASGDPHALWLYILAPIVGTSIGGLAYHFVRDERTRPAELQTDVERREQAA